MCNSCVIPFHGLYLQQCPKCGHPGHEPGRCVVGSADFYHTMNGQIHQKNCLCPDRNACRDGQP